MPEYSKPSLFTIGYERRPLDNFLTALTSRSIEVLVDVRLRPQSRRRGFSKTALSEACERVGITYVHDRGLGTPADIMDRFRRTGWYDWDGYVEHLDTNPKLLEGAFDTSSRFRTCLMCYELEPAECHRRFVADRLSSQVGLRRIDV